MSGPSLNPWALAAERVSRVLFRIETDTKAGTAFAILWAEDPSKHGFATLFATANHIVADYKQGSPLSLTSADGSSTLDTQACTLTVIPPSSGDYDIALISATSERSILPPSYLVPLLSHDLYAPRGAQLGWLGFPSIVWPELCFFQGSLSGYLSEPYAYLVDGVAINGVSGGPAFNNEGTVFGVVQSYIPNRPTKELTLPGLMAVVPIASLDHWISSSLKVRPIPAAP
jgi:hypothetical protein